jgi:hypothetical protein
MRIQVDVNSYRAKFQGLKKASLKKQGFNVARFQRHEATLER